MAKFAWSIVFAVMALGVGAGSSAAVLGSPQDEEAIRRIVAEMTEAFNGHDAKAATTMYTPDADFVSVRGETGLGVAEAEKRLTAIFATRAREATLKTLDVRVRFIRSDVALVHVTNELSGLVTASGQKLPPHQELSLRVFVKDDGVWRVASFHNTMIQPFEASAK